MRLGGRWVGNTAHPWPEWLATVALCISMPHGTISIKIKVGC